MTNPSGEPNAAEKHVRGMVKLTIDGAHNSPSCYSLTDIVDSILGVADRAAEKWAAENERVHSQYTGQACSARSLYDVALQEATVLSYAAAHPSDRLFADKVASELIERLMQFPGQ